MQPLLYDETNIDSIVAYAQRLEDKSVDTVNYEQHSHGGRNQSTPQSMPVQNKNNKGGFGNFIESAYFGKKNDNKSQPDFPLAQLELKVSPLKYMETADFSVRVKERLVLNHFTFASLDKEVFESSHFIEKNKNLLIIFYLYEKDKPYGKLHIQLADLWQCIKEDEFQIRQDWETIVKKIKAGKAHEISEGDTLYLGACTKGATAESSMQVQPHSPIKAKGRAFCFKLGYINHIYQTLLSRKKNGRRAEQRLLGRNESLEPKILSIFSPYLKKSTPEIYRMRCKTYNPNNKSRYANIARDIVGLNKDKSNIYEFNAASIQFKTIRVEPNGRSRESMSFKTIDFCEIVNEEWEDSYFYDAITSRFVLVLFKRDTMEEEYYLDRVLLWQIPQEDYDKFKDVWLDTRNKIRHGDYGHFLKISENPVSHIRPHGKDATDTMITPQGRQEKKMSFWINQGYIQAKVLDSIYRQ